MDMVSRVLVTGAAGRIGRAVLDALAVWGVPATALVLEPVAGDLLADRVVVGDAGDPVAVRRALEDVDAVVHLAAITHPLRNTPYTVYGTNTMATLTVLEEAGRAGVRHVCLAGSYGVTGLPWTDQEAHPAYLPIDEATPTVVADPYGLSKQADELTAAMMARRHGMSIVTLRYPFIGDHERLADRAALYRSDPAAGAAELWTYLDVRDAAAAALAALRVDTREAQAVYLCAPDTLSDEPTADLLARFHPDVPVRVPVVGRVALIDTAAASMLFGFEAAFPFGSGC